MREVEGNGDREIDKVTRVKRVECVLYGIAGTMVLFGFSQ